MPLYRRFLPFFLRLQRSGPRKPGKCEIWNNNSAELRNQWTYEAYKQFHLCEATSNRRIVSLLWHLGDNKYSKQPKKLPPFPFFCKSSIKYYSENIILTGSPHQVGNFVMGREVRQGKTKYLKISCSYVLKSTSCLSLAVSLAWSSPARAVLPLLVMITGWHNQPRFTLLPTMQHLRPPTLPLPTIILLGTGAVVLGMQWIWFAEHQRSEKRPTKGLGEGHQPSRETGEDSGCFSQIKEISKKTDFRGRGVHWIIYSWRD